MTKLSFPEMVQSNNIANKLSRKSMVQEQKLKIMRTYHVRKKHQQKRFSQLVFSDPRRTHKKNSHFFRKTQQS